VIREAGCEMAGGAQPPQKKMPEYTGFSDH
jgi:hypothetical protein